jgi:hypothetical protein
LIASLTASLVESVASFVASTACFATSPTASPACFAASATSPAVSAAAAAPSLAASEHRQRDQSRGHRQFRVHIDALSQSTVNAGLIVDLRTALGNARK